MSKKSKKHLASLLGNVEVVLFNRFVLNSSVLPEMINSTNYTGNLTLDLTGKNFSEPGHATVSVNFLREDQALTAPSFNTSDIFCQQYMSSYQTLMHMVERGIERKKKRYFFYAFLSRHPAWMQFLLTDEPLNEKTILYVHKKVSDTVRPQPAFFSSLSPGKR